MTIPILAHPRRPLVAEDLFPDADRTDGIWVEIADLTNNVNLFSFVDDDVTPDSDGVTTESPGGGRFLTVCGSPVDEESFILDFPDFTDAPSGAESFVMEVRARRKDTFGSGNTVEMDIDLLQGGTTIASDNNNTLTTSFAQVDMVMSQGEINQLLTDTTDMRVRISARGCVASIGDEADCEVTMIRFRIN